MRAEELEEAWRRKHLRRSGLRHEQEAAALIATKKTGAARVDTMEPYYSNSSQGIRGGNGRESDLLCVRRGMGGRGQALSAASTVPKLVRTVFAWNVSPHIYCTEGYVRYRARGLDDHVVKTGRCCPDISRWESRLSVTA